MKKKPSSPENKVTLTLSTGYEVEIDLLDARKGLEHLARALMCEIMYPKLKRSLKAGKKSNSRPGLPPGLEETAAEIAKIVRKCATSDLRTLVIAVISAYLVGEFERISQKENAGN
jgi:hypothetical protein